jgi:hypothetical protein
VIQKRNILLMSWLWTAILIVVVLKRNMYVAFSNIDIIEIVCFWTVISSNCVISVFNYILSVNCPIYPLFSLSLCVSLEQRCNRSFMKLIFFWQLISFLLQINFFCVFESFWYDDVKNELKKILFWCVFK